MVPGQPFNEMKPNSGRARMELCRSTATKLLWGFFDPRKNPLISSTTLETNFVRRITRPFRLISIEARQSTPFA
jgi:hypothetical protein